jgi:hypothetical protein
MPEFAKGMKGKLILVQLTKNPRQEITYPGKGVAANVFLFFGNFKEETIEAFPGAIGRKVRGTYWLQACQRSNAAKTRNAGIQQLVVVAHKVFVGVNHAGIANFYLLQCVLHLGFVEIEKIAVGVLAQISGGCRIHPPKKNVVGIGDADVGYGVYKNRCGGAGRLFCRTVNALDQLVLLL